MCSDVSSCVSHSSRSVKITLFIFSFIVLSAKVKCYHILLLLLIYMYTQYTQQCILTRFSQRTFCGFRIDFLSTSSDNKFLYRLNSRSKAASSGSRREEESDGSTTFSNILNNRRAKIQQRNAVSLLSTTSSISLADIFTNQKTGFDISPSLSISRWKPGLIVT